MYINKQQEIQPGFGPGGGVSTFFFILFNFLNFTHPTANNSAQ